MQISWSLSMFHRSRPDEEGEKIEMGGDIKISHLFMVACMPIPMLCAEYTAQARNMTITGLLSSAPYACIVGIHSRSAAANH